MLPSSAPADLRNKQISHSQRPQNYEVVLHQPGADSWELMNKKILWREPTKNTSETHLHLKHLADAGFLKTEPQSVAPGPF